MFVRESVMVGGRPLTFETGRLAKLAHGAVLATYGESMVLVTAVSSEERPGLDFFPLTCEYVEKTYAAGPIAGMRVARVEGELVALPTFEQSAKADIDLIVACTKDAIVMVEGGAEEASETEIIDALYFAFSEA